MLPQISTDVLVLCTTVFELGEHTPVCGWLCGHALASVTNSAETGAGHSLAVCDTSLLGKSPQTHQLCQS